MKIQGAKRLEAIDAPSFSELFEAKKQYAQKTGQEVIDFSIGSSNISPHPDLKNALSKAVLDDSVYQYSLSPMPEIVQAIQDWYAKRYGVQLEEDEIFLVKGSQEALSHIPLVFCDRSEERRVGKECG